ncbi:RNA polymerase sigma factor [Paenibacillus allorhizosphaerae]|uniref:RNA polymerase subunit sigma-70 n=1 Tax=Paenibacillus allorhizosphaerae TaxID=2849866 RepID=A0ABM8VAH7_9BACL|nr:DUF6596 domain-containing protein [Paenibacillus allorhizosphaerae]CAG7616543.1 hypothetical protein PAECIP111802_00300 [Paenibacillus allorhizosphaerae]
MNTQHIIELTARESYGRLVAYLSVRWRDVEAAEDALADAFLIALETWPRIGVPDKPEAWLLTTARRRLIDRARRGRIHERVMPALQAMSEEVQQRSSSGMDFPDERLKMLLMCTHPSIDPSVRTPLMLQTVLGIDAARIASSFIVKPSTMGQRLTRVKANLRAKDVKFEMPHPEQWPERLDSVLEAIYAAYGSGWDDVTGVDERRKGLAEEAIYLGRLLVRFMPEEPEAQALLALMLHCEARRDARRDVGGNYVPLSEQDMTLWSETMIAEAERCLHRAAQVGRVGRFQLLAAIQSVHAQRAWSGRTAWDEIALLYEGLVRLAPTIGAAVGRAAAMAEAQGPQHGWALLEAIPSAQVVSYQPYWALAAHLLMRMERHEEARTAYSRAIGLCADPSVREFLKRQADHAG